eukprot:1193579-Prorocentrum_minimum.AAC.6
MVCGAGVYTYTVSQWCAEQGGIYLHCEPMVCGAGVYTYTVSRERPKRGLDTRQQRPPERMGGRIDFSSDEIA